MTNDPSKDRPLFAKPPAEEDVPTTEFDAAPAADQSVTEVDRRPVTAPAAPAEDDEVMALRDATFPYALRGYNTHAVDRYVAEVQRSVARFEESRSPTEAVRRALDRVGEQTAAILQEAERSAEETTAASRAQADDRV